MGLGTGCNSFNSIVYTARPCLCTTQVWRELVADVGNDPEEVGLETWCSIKPRILQLAAREGETRNSIRVVQKEQHQELERYQQGQLNYADVYIHTKIAHCE